MLFFARGSEARPRRRWRPYWLREIPVPAKQGRSCKRKLFQVDEVRQGMRYSQKMVEVYHVVKGDVIVVVTVYVFFGGWES